MTEAEWLASEDPERLLEHLGTRISARKARLFGCCKRHFVWQYLVDERSQTALEVSERFADGLASQDELVAAHRAAFAAVLEISELFGADDDAYQMAAGLMWAVAFEPTRNLLAGRHAGDVDAVLTYLRDIFGNPFRPTVFDSSWRTETVAALTAQMYESRDFSAMPILADALQDAGCDSEEILNHCRDSQQTHVRGCWVVDLVLGKA